MRWKSLLFSRYKIRNGGRFNHNEAISIFNYDETVQISSSSSQPIKMHPIWLRHHCQCEKCFNSKTFQKSLIPSDLPSISGIKDIDEANGSIRITWNNDHISTYDLKWIQINYMKMLNNPLISEKITQTGPSSGSKCPTNHAVRPPKDPLENAIGHGELMQEDRNDGITKLLRNISQFGYGIVKDAPQDFESTKDVVRKISHPQNTIYGDFSEWTSNLEHKDTAYTSDYVYLHTDTSYFSEPMGLQMFHCLKHDGTGGINSIVDGFKVAQDFKTKSPSGYNLLSTVEIPYHYIDPGKHHFYNVDTILSHHTNGQLRRVRYNPHDLAVINTIPHELIGSYYSALVTFSEEIEKNPTWIKLLPGIIIFLDNWRTLHGRSEFTGFRHLSGAYISRSDWLSKARVLRIISTLQ